jgi:catechol 2,3-dioxygenase-like lactoylglutathione lyase family enzyme
VPESRENAARLRVWARQHCALGVQTEHPVPADEKSGLHFCFTAANAAAVDAFHAAALRSGGQDNGAPGLRPTYGPDYYAAFIIDPDGYRIEAYYGPAKT